MSFSVTILGSSSAKPTANRHPSAQAVNVHEQYYLVDALKDERSEIIHVNPPVSSVLRIGELEIYHEYRRVLMAGREVRLNHGEYAMLYCMASAPGQVFSKAQLYAAAWGEEYLHGTTSVENIIWRLRQKLEKDPKHPEYIKTVIGTGYKIETP